MMQANEQETFLGLVAVSKEDHTTYTIIAGRTLRRHGHGLGPPTAPNDAPRADLSAASCLDASPVPPQPPSLASPKRQVDREKQAGQASHHDSAVQTVGSSRPPASSSGPSSWPRFPASAVASFAHANRRAPGPCLISRARMAMTVPAAQQGHKGTKDTAKQHVGHLFFFNCCSTQAARPVRLCTRRVRVVRALSSLADAPLDEPL
ncbi:hypothetical protein Purlil1_8321 [Purpureocillium lilacinum]|uniref:Uncharacterized protein n=1 Tax=Purpureocillium lilacinum TaxID=33203 RepID=A0ABR0BTM1_PURLI|nr:hypothetical protein Purlil1_8321 [Purpureocillium lilacinum]